MFYISHEYMLVFLCSHPFHYWFGCLRLRTAGEGTWTLDTNHPWLLDLAKVIGTDLTPEACADLYAKSWSKSHSITSAEDEAED